MKRLAAALLALWLVTPGVAWGDLLLQSTAYTRQFLMVQSSDHITGITGATVSCNCGKAGASGAACGGTVSQVDSTNLPGVYKIVYTTTDTNTLGSLVVNCTATSADPQTFSDQVVAFDFMSTATPTTNPTKFGGTTVTGRDIGASVLLSSGTGTGQISLSSGAVTVGTNNDKTGYSLSQSFPSNFSSLAIDGSGRVQLQYGTSTGQVACSAGVCDVNATQMGGTPLTARDIGASVLLSSGTGTGQVKLSSGYVAPNWGDVGNPTTTVGLTNTTISTSQAIASVSGAVGSVTGAVGSLASVTNIWNAALPGAYGAGTAGYIIGNTATLPQLFTLDTGETFATAVPGSVVYETAAGAGGGSTTVTDITAPALAKFFTVDTGETAATAVAGSVVGELYQTTASLSDFFTVDTGQTYATSVPGSIVKEMAYGVGMHQNLANPAYKFDLWLTNGNAATGKTDSSFTTKKYQCGTAAWADLTGTIQEIGRGTYYIPLTAAQTNGARCYYQFQASGTQTTTRQVDYNPE